MKKIFKFIYTPILILVFFVTIPLIYIGIIYSFDKLIELSNLELGTTKELWFWLYFAIIVTFSPPFVALWLFPFISKIIIVIMNKFKSKKAIEKPLTRSERILIRVMMERKEKRENEKKANDQMQTNN